MKIKYTDDMTDMLTKQLATVATLIKYFDSNGHDTTVLKANHSKLQKTLNLYIKSKLTQVSSLNKKNV